MPTPQDLNYSTPSADRRHKSATLVALTGFIVLFPASAILIAINVHALWQVPPGTPIRPMGLASLDFTVSVVAFLCGSFLALCIPLVGPRSARTWRLALSLFLASLAPYAASILSIIATSYLRGLILEG
jgi:hypothetical protein